MNRNRKDIVIQAAQARLDDAGDKNWRSGPLGDFLTLQRGFDLPTKDRRAGNVPIVSSSGISGRHDEARASGPGVVTGRYGTVGEVFFIEQDYWPLNTTLWVKDFKGNDPRFAYFLLKTLDFNSCSDKSSVPGVNRNDLHRIPITAPTLPEQRAIAHVLGTLDDKIELNRRMNETLEGIARAIFQSWFVDFDPVRYNMQRAGEERAYARTGRAARFGSFGEDMSLIDDSGRRRPLRSEDIHRPVAHLFPDAFEDSPLGPIPKGWQCVPLPELIEVNPSCPLRKGETAPYLDMANMPTRGHMPEAWIDRPFGSGTRFVNGDTLVARITPCLENGKTAFVTFLSAGQVGWGSTEFIVLRPKPPLPALFAYCLARSDEFRQFAIQKMTGSSGRQRVPADSLSRYHLAEPEVPVMQAFGKLVEPLFAQATAIANQSRTLAAIRDALLPKLLSGEIRVKDAKRIVERCA